MTYTVWDVETTTKTQHKRKASPFCLDNHVVASGFKTKGMALPAYDYFGRSRPSGDWFRKLLAASKMLVGFNIKFDLLHALTDADNYTAWKRWVVDGGRIWDCQLAEYHIHGMAREHHMLSLDEVAPRYGGNLKNDAVKALWEAGVDTTDIDKDLLLEYLVGTGPDDLGDIGNTEKIFLGQIAALRARNGINTVALGMDAMLAVIECERNGMYVDKALGLTLAAELESTLKTITEELVGYLPADMPKELTFNWGSRFHLSALVFGGSVKYKAKATILDADGKPTYYQVDELHYVMVDGTTTPLKPSENVDNIFKYATFAGGKNKGEFKTKKVKVPDIARGPKDRYEDFHFTFPGFTEPSPEWESSTPGVYSVASEVIAALGNRDVPFLKTLATMAAMQKDLGTYYITTDEDTGEQKGMLTLVGDDGIVHHSINQCSTVTARFSSSNPNLQNVSGSGKSQVKSLFRSRFKHGKIVQSDFTALEIYVQAILTKCRQLIEDLRAGLDMHCVRVSQKTGEPYEEVLAKAKDEKHPEHKVYHKLRKGAKEFSFQRAYGAGVTAIAASTGMSEEDVEALVLAEAERYPEVDQFYVALTEQIARNRTPTNRFLQHPELPGIQCQLGRSYYVTPDGKMYSYSEHPAPAWLVRQTKVAQSFSPPEIRNYVVQGSGAEWAKAALAITIRMFYLFDNFGGLALLVNQVHDAEYVDADDSVAVRAAALLHACMEEASAYMEYKFNWLVPVPVPSETKFGTSMIEELDLPADEFRPLVAEYRKLVRDRMMPGFIPSFDKKQETEHGTV